MNQGELISIFREAIIVALKVSLPILITAVVIGVIISILQAVTQVQEQTLTFLPKLLGIAVVGLLTGSFMISTTVKFTTKILEIISNL